MSRRSDLAYLAGIIDGEGYIGITRSKPYRHLTGRRTPGYHAKMQVRMTHEGAIRFLAETLGGWYWREKSHANNGKPLYCWQASDLTAERVLREVWPFLRVKHDQAATVLELRALQSGGRKHRTKVIGHREFPNARGTIRRVENRAYSDEYVGWCDALYERCRELNRVGVHP